MNTQRFSVLFIGNSFSECTCAYLYDFLTALGIPSPNIAALKISAATIDMHWANAQNDAPAYLFYRYTTSGDRETASASCTLKEGLSSNRWDWVVFADGSASLGSLSACTNLPPLVEYVKRLTTPGKTKFAFNMTWPWELGYKKYSEHFDGSPEVMFRRIASGVQKAMLANPDITCVLPNGAAIRSALLSGWAPALYRDGSHLNANGCFIVSLATAYTLLQHTEGFRHDDSSRLPCLPTNPHRTNGSFIGSLEPEYADLFREAAAAALAAPFGSTER